MRRSAVALVGVLALAACGGGGTNRPAVSAPAPSLPGRELDPARTRALPAQGLVVDRKGGLVLVRLDGSVVGHLGGFRVDLLSEQGRYDRVVYVEDRGGREWSVGRRGLRRTSRPSVVRFPPGYDGCDRVVASYFICGRPGPRRQTSRVARRGADGRLHRVLGPAMRTRYGVVGRWIGVHPAPEGGVLLLQWSGECEIPRAYLAASTGSRLRPLDTSASTSSAALGWTADGRAVVSIVQGDCGRAAGTVTYAVDPHDGARTAIFRGSASFWGDASTGAGD